MPVLVAEVVAVVAMLVATIGLPLSLPPLMSCKFDAGIESRPGDFDTLRVQTDRCKGPFAYSAVLTK